MCALNNRLSFWQAIGYSLPFDSTAQSIDEFNQEIQKDILHWEHRDPNEALCLGQLKLEVNRRFFNMKRDGHAV